MEVIKLQEIIDRFYNNGIDDLELKTFKNGVIELGYWSHMPATILIIKDNNIEDCAFFPQRKPSDYVSAPKEKQEIIFENIHWIWELIGSKKFIDIDEVDKMKHIILFFKEEDANE